MKALKDLFYLSPNQLVPWISFWDLFNQFLTVLSRTIRCWLRYCLMCVGLVLSVGAYAVPPSDENYDDNTNQAIFSQDSFSRDGITYTVTGAFSPYNHIITNNSVYTVMADNGTDRVLLIDAVGNAINSLTIEAQSGGSFKLNGMSFDLIADGDVTITPYNGVVAGTPLTYTLNGNRTVWQNVDLSLNCAFQNITKVVFSGTNMHVVLDDLDFESPIPAPVVTDNNIAITSIGSGVSGAYKIGDTVAMTWDNSGAGDNNSGIVSVSSDFSSFGGGSSVNATESSGLWSASYVITAGSVDQTNLNVSVTASNGCPITTADLTNLTVDNIIPSVSSSAVSGSPAAADSSVDFLVSFDETVSNLSADDFTLAATGSASGSISSVSATSGSSVTVTVSGISGNGTIKVNVNSGTDISDDVGNTGLAAYSSGTAHTVLVPIVAPDAPSIGSATAGDASASVSFTAPVNDGGAAITSYTVTSSPGGLTETGSSSPITVTGLTNGVSYTFSVTATNSAGTSSPSSASNAVTPNAAPTISGSPSTQIDMGSTYLFVPTASDPDDDALLRFSIANKPQWAVFDELTGGITGKPLREHVGLSDPIVITVSDGSLSASLPAFTIEVLSSNSAPTAVDDELSVNLSSDSTYLLNVLVNDTDPDNDELIITAVKSPVGAVTIQDNQVLFNAPANLSGGLTLEYRITDGEFSATAKVELNINGKNLLAPVVTPPADKRVNATGLFTKVDLGVAMAKDKNNNTLPTKLLNGLPLFRPGVHQLFWQATDGEGVSSVAVQTLSVVPLVSLSKPQQVKNNSTVTVTAYLNGPAPEYPFTVPYSVLASSTADSSDFDLMSGVVVFEQGLSAEIRFNVHAKMSTPTSKTVSLALNESVNRGANYQTDVTITDGNIAPTLTLVANQSKQQRIVVSQDGGPVMVTAKTDDLNHDSVSLAWDADPALDAIVLNEHLSFDPAKVAVGTYKVRAVATDNGAPSLSQSQELYLYVIASLPSLGSGDSNNNLISDAEEGWGDSNNNGIPDYLDSGFDCRVISEQLTLRDKFLAEGEPSVCIRKGAAALTHLLGGIALANVPNDTEAQYSGGVFDFIVYSLPVPGQSYRVVLSQLQPVPLNAIYRKYRSGSWHNFVMDSMNSVSSAEGEAGYCPPPGSSSYQTGLTAGHWCVQLTLSDGGPNDADGSINGSIADPGGVAVVLSGNQLPSAKDDTFSVQWNQNHVLSVLANDSDADKDTLSVFQVSAAFGDVSISTDGQTLLYRPKTDFVGTDTLTYGISDGKGGSSSASVAVEVYYNRAPVVSNASAQTDDRSMLIIDLSAFASDPDKDALTVSALTVDQGVATLENGLRIRYTPAKGFEGNANLKAMISDGRGGNSELTLTIKITAFKTVTVENRSSGGSAGALSIIALMVFALWRRYGVSSMSIVKGKCMKHKMMTQLARLSVGIMLLSSGVLYANEFVKEERNTGWLISASLGKSQASTTESDVMGRLSAGVTLGEYDRSSESWQLGIGYRLAEDWQLLLAYTDLGNTSLRLTADTLDPDAFAASVANVGPLLATGVKAGVNYRLFAHQAWQVNIGAGLWRWQSDLDSTMFGNGILKKTVGDFSGTDAYVDLSLGYQLTKRMTLIAGWQYLRLDSNSATNWQLGASLSF